MTADTRRDQIAAKLHDQGCIKTGDCGGICRADATDAVLPILHAAVAKACAETAEAIAQAIATAPYPQPETAEYVRKQAVGIARQHGKDQP